MAQEKESQENDIMMRRLEKLRERVIYLEHISSSRSKRISQMAHQLAINEVPYFDWDSKNPPNIDTESGKTDPYSLVSNILQRSQKTVLENEREEKILRDFSNLVRHSVVNQQSQAKADSFNAQNSFYSKLVNFWRILFPGSEKHCPETIDDLAYGISETLKEIKKEADSTKNVKIIMTYC